MARQKPKKLSPVERTKDFAEVEGAFAKHEALAEAGRCLFCHDAPCNKKCPAGIDVVNFIRKIKTANLTGSARIIYDANIFGGTCGRICPSEILCESGCSSTELSEPINIRALQRYVCDAALLKFITKSAASPSTPDASPLAPQGQSAKKVAVIGSGPGGLACAYNLCKAGISVVVYESKKLAGGLLRYGIPGYRLPEQSLDDEIRLIEKSCGDKLKILTNTTVGAHIPNAGALIPNAGALIPGAGALIPGAGAHVPFEQLLQGFDFVYIGVGLGGSHKLNIPGENMECVLSAEDFLSGVNSGEKIDFSGKKIAVIGAGNTAMDSACASKRLGAKAVTVIYRRSAEEMPAWKNEYESAVEEGVEFMWLTQPVEITTESELKCVRTTLGEKDASGRRSPVPVPGSDFLIQVDIILKALGQKPDTVFINKMADAFKIQTKNGLIIIDEKTCRTTNPRIFAGGDCANGGLTAVEAVACGKRAATSIIAASIVAAFITNEPLA